MFLSFFFFFFNDTAPTEIYTLSLHDALPICGPGLRPPSPRSRVAGDAKRGSAPHRERASEAGERRDYPCPQKGERAGEDAPRVPEGAVQGGGTREGLHHALPAVHVQPPRFDPEP